MNKKAFNITLSGEGKSLKLADNILPMQYNCLKFDIIRIEPIAIDAINQTLFSK